jgi:hypothetical protein
MKIHVSKMVEVYILDTSMYSANYFYFFKESILKETWNDFKFIGSTVYYRRTRTMD